MLQELIIFPAKFFFGAGGRIRYHFESREPVSHRNFRIVLRLLCMTVRVHSFTVMFMDVAKKVPSYGSLF